MALYDGFFDSVLDDETEEYDRAYESGDFTGYFEKIIGSGVCVHGNADSFKVRLESGKAVVSPGYLFIQGYWLKNSADYQIELPGTGNYAIAAKLSLGQRMIELKAQSVAQAYPDSLVLAIVSPAAAEDTRHNTDICGVIDTAGELSGKVEWALNYINTEIESKLQQVEQDIAAQDAKLDAKIAEVQAVADSIVPPPIGAIKFSASESVDDTWLQCDGSFINESDYPELVAALGKLTPSGDKFQLISSGEIGPQISNGVVYGGRLWVYSYSTKKLYGVDVVGTAAVKEIVLTSENAHFGDFISPSTANPICLSIVPHISGSGAKIFMTQIIKDGGLYTALSDYAWMEYCLIFGSDFTGEESEIALAPPFASIVEMPGVGVFPRWSANNSIPYVVSFQEGGIEYYYLFSGGGATRSSPSGYIASLKWKDESSANAETVSSDFGYVYISNYTIYNENQRYGYSKKSSKEGVSVSLAKGAGSASYGYSYSISSGPIGQFNYSGTITSAPALTFRESYAPINVAGEDFVVAAYDKDLFPCWSRKSLALSIAKPGLPLPSASRVFIDGGAYLWGKDIYMFFVGTGIIFSRTLQEGDFGYLDTTSVLGTITQFGYLDYSQDVGTLYLLGQDTTNTVKVAKIVLNALYDYANDGAWLPMIASDGVPAYIKAKEAET